MKSNLVDIAVQIHAETPKAIKVSDDGDARKAVWLPKQHLEIIPKPKATAIITLPEWLAIEKGFV